MTESPLSPEEWAELLKTGSPVRPRDRATEEVLEMHPVDRHAVAIVALFGESFGFTSDDVKLLRDIVEKYDMEINRQESSALTNLADRIAALLPPESV